jgi:hypothetical protein
MRMAAQAEERLLNPRAITEILTNDSDYPQD